MSATGLTTNGTMTCDELPIDGTLIPDIPEHYASHGGSCMLAYIAYYYIIVTNDTRVKQK